MFGDVANISGSKAERLKKLAEGLLAHLANIDKLLGEALKISQITRVKVHGAADELTKLVKPLSSLSPTYFTLEYGIRRSF